MPPCATLQALRYLHRASSALVALRCFGNARAPGSTLLTSLLATSSSRVRSWAVVGGALLVRRTGNETSPAGCCGLPLRAWPGVHAVELVLQCSLLTSLVQRGVILVRYREKQGICTQEAQGSPAKAEPSEVSATMTVRTPRQRPPGGCIL